MNTRIKDWLRLIQNHKAKEGNLFQLSEGQDRFLFCKKLHGSYSQPKCVVKLLIYIHIHSSVIPWLTSKKETYISNMSFWLCLYFNNFDNASFILAQIAIVTKLWLPEVPSYFILFVNHLDKKRTIRLNKQILKTCWNQSC